MTNNFAPLQTGFKVPSIAEATDAWFAKKKREAGDSLSHPKEMSEFDPGLAFSDAGLGESVTGGPSFNTSTTENKNLSRLQKLPYGEAGVTPPKKIVVKKNMNLRLFLNSFGARVCSL